MAVSPSHGSTRPTRWERCVFCCATAGAAGAFNLCAPAPLTNRQFSRALGAALRRPSLLPVPGFLFRAMFGEVATVVLEGQWALPQRLLASGYEFRFAQADAALADSVANGQG